MTRVPRTGIVIFTAKDTKAALFRALRKVTMMAKAIRLFPSTKARALATPTP